jgi:hypothetical protein
MHEDRNAPPSRTGSRPARALAALAVVTLLFAAAGAWPVPDVNEAVYLTKARHHADPAWGQGDFFLETPDAHGGFYVVFGPLAAALPLDTVAWIGRWLGWLAVAAGFVHAVLPLAVGGPRTSASAHAPAASAAGAAEPPPAWAAADARAWATVVLAGALFSLALRHTTMAGEWVIGGCEAKVFAWACVLAGVGEVARGRWAGGVFAMGTGTALHVLVGGWGLVALVGAWLLGWALDRLRGWPGRVEHERGGGWTSAALVAAGLGLVAWAVVPALELSAGAAAADRAAAVRTYVVERLHHHLLPRSFAEPLVSRHLLAILAWWLLARLVPFTPARGRVTGFVLAALGISAAGWAISWAEPLAPGPVLALLRYYWFRLADVIVPFALAASAALVVADADTCRRLLPLPAWVLRGALVLGLVGGVVAESAHWPLPGRPGLVPRADSKVDGPAWIDICGWVRDHAPADACFLTPRGAASFTWRTGRREVVSWKNSPQDVAALLEWRRRIVDCYSASGSLANMERSTAALGAARMRDVADRYGAGFAIVPADVVGLSDLPFPVLHRNTGYVVLDLTAAP